MFSCVLLNIVKNNFNDDVCLLGPMAMRPMWHTGPSPCTSPAVSPPWEMFLSIEQCNAQPAPTLP